MGVGDPAPPLRGPALFPDGSEGDLDLADLRGRPVILAFYPADNSPVCTRQLNAYSSGIDRLRDIDADLVAISPQGIDRHRAFAAANGGFPFPLVADGDKAIARAWGVPGPLGFYRRSTFVVAADGIVRHAHRATAGLTFQGVGDLVAAVERSR